MPTTIRVWDLPTRLFHWLLAGCFAGSLVSIQLGGNAVAWHFRFGYATLALVVFRVAWGFVGPRYARFSSFPPSPTRAWRYLRGSLGAPPAPGHSPLAALSVYAMLLAFTIQAVTGLFANDAIMWDGPLKNLVSNATSDAFTRVHKINRVVCIVLVLLHLCAITYYRLAKRRNLVGPMIVGDSLVAPAHAHAHTRDDAAVRLRALLLLVAAAAVVWAIVGLGARAGPTF